MPNSLLPHRTGEQGPRLAVVSANLAMADTLAAAGQEVLLAGGAARLASGARVHTFHVSPLDRFSRIQVVSEDALAAVKLRSPDGKSHPLTTSATTLGIWTCAPPDPEVGPWTLEVRVGDERSLSRRDTRSAGATWAYQVWVTSTLRGDMLARPSQTTGKPLRTALDLHGVSVDRVQCEAFVSRPEAAIDNFVAEHHSRLRASIAAMLTKYWPNQSNRPWWSLLQRHKLALLRDAGIAVPERLRIPRSVYQCHHAPGRPERYLLTLPATDTTVPGVYQVVMRARGHVEGQKFERIAYRQVSVVAAPEVGVPTSTGKRPVFRLTMRDRFGNFAPVSAGGPIGFDLRDIRGAALRHTLTFRDDGTVAFEILDTHRDLSQVLVRPRQGPRELEPVHVSLSRDPRDPR